MPSEKLIDFYEENKDRLRRLARHGEPMISAMALSILSTAGDKEAEN